MIEVKTHRSLFTVPMSLCCDPQETGIVNELGFDSNWKNYPYVKRGNCSKSTSKKRRPHIIYRLHNACESNVKQLLGNYISGLQCGL